MEFLGYLPAAVAGYYAFHLTSHPKSKLRGKIPHVKVSRVQVSPSIRLYAFGRTIWMHHWLNLAILLAISIPLNIGLLDHSVMKGFMVGGILQGLTFSDAMQIVRKTT